MVNYCNNKLGQQSTESISSSGEEDDAKNKDNIAYKRRKKKQHIGTALQDEIIRLRKFTVG